MIICKISSAYNTRFSQKVLRVICTEHVRMNTKICAKPSRYSSTVKSIDKQNVIFQITMYVEWITYIVTDHGSSSGTVLIILVLHKRFFHKGDVIMSVMTS